jgi:hypothetical protein
MLQPVSCSIHPQSEPPPVQCHSEFSRQRVLSAVDLTVVVPLELDGCDIAEGAV